MKIKITFLLGFLLLSQAILAQFARDDVKFWLGEGYKESFFAVDFRDGTTDPSFVFGFRFNEDDNLAFFNILEELALIEPVFSHEMSGMFLDDVIYNSHKGLAADPDWWSTWSGSSSDTMTMNGGMSESLVPDRWYGLSYGFAPAPQMPTTTYPAYHSQWFTGEEFEYSLGEGEDYAVIVVDFVEENGNEPVSFAWKIQFEESITAKDALLLIADLDSQFEVEFDEEELLSIQYKELQGNDWLAYQGTNLSDWKLAETDVLENESWFGWAQGETYTRRPFTPVPAEESPVIGIEDFAKNNFRVYPNPVDNILNIRTEGSGYIQIFDVSGREIFTANIDLNKKIDFSGFQNGVYFLQFTSDGKMSSQKVVKQ